MLKRLSLVALAISAAIALSSCPSTGALGKPSLEFTRAARAYTETLGSDYREYVLADETLTPTQRQNRLDAVGDFEFAVRMAEKRNGIPSPAQLPEAPAAEVDQ